MPSIMKLDLSKLSICYAMRSKIKSDNVKIIFLHHKCYS